MKHARRTIDRLALSLVIALGVSVTSTSNASLQLAEVVIKDITGTASCFTAGIWRPLEKDMHLKQGAIIRTDKDSTVDLLFLSSFTSLRLTPNSSLRLDKLLQEPGADMWVTDTTLTLLSGGVAGTQRKLAAPSRFQLKTADRVARIVGTEYFVRADGAVTVTSGAVTINWNQPGAGGSVKVTIPAGSTFDPATGQVVPTNPAYLQDIIAHIETTRHNAQVFKPNGGTLVVKPEEFVSPH